jgi:hypothetical protein
MVELFSSGDISISSTDDLDSVGLGVTIAGVGLVSTIECGP